jgi:hypothetical protein
VSLPIQSEPTISTPTNPSPKPAPIAPINPPAPTPKRF